MNEELLLNQKGFAGMFGVGEGGKSPRPVRTIKAIRAIKAQLTQLPFEVVDVACCVFQQAELMFLMMPDLSCSSPHFRFPAHSQQCAMGPPQLSLRMLV